MNPLEELQSIRDIQILKARYCRFVDTRQWDELQRLFVPEATLFFPEGQQKPAGVADSMAFIRQVLNGTISVHIGHSPEIQLQTADSARGIWGMEDLLYWSTEAAASCGVESVHGYGHYHEEYVRRAGRWLFKSLKLTRLRIEKRAAPRAVA
jgi:hypothetical protein